jgi:hypothetical protein
MTAERSSPTAVAAYRRPKMTEASAETIDFTVKEATARARVDRGSAFAATGHDNHKAKNGAKPTVSPIFVVVDLRASGTGEIFAETPCASRQ